MLSAEERTVIKAAQAGKAAEAFALVADLRLSVDRNLWLTGAVQLHLATNSEEKAAAGVTLRSALNHPWATPQTKVFALLDLSHVATTLNDWGLWREMYEAAEECERDYQEVEHVPQALACFWLNYGQHLAVEQRYIDAEFYLKRALVDRSPGNWCVRYTALNHLARLAALRGEVRRDLLEKAMSELPPEQAAKLAGEAMLTRAYLLFAQGKWAEAQLMGITALRKLQGEKNSYEVVLADIFLVRLAITRGESVSTEVISRLRQNGQVHPFGLFVARRLMKGEGVKQCVSVS